MRQWLTDKREKAGLTIEALATLCGCSKILLEKLENDDWITHQHIVSRIAHYCKLSLEEYNELVLEKHRAKKLPPPRRLLTDRDYYESKYALEGRYKKQR